MILLPFKRAARITCGRADQIRMNSWHWELGSEDCWASPAEIIEAIAQPWITEGSKVVQTVYDSGQRLVEVFPHWWHQ